MSAMGWESMFRAMRDDDRRAALEALLAVMEADASGEGGAEPPCCPRYGCPHVARRGRDADGSQRWLCRGCGRTFRGTTGSVLASSRLDGPTWAEYFPLMVSGATLGDCAAACDASLRASFSMRHRLLEVTGRSPPVFEAGPGCPVQVDETLVPDSLSGNHSRGGAPMPRAARRRSGDGVRGGVSRDKVSVVVAANPRRGVFPREACRGKLCVGDARRVMADCAVEGAVVSTDRQKGYVRAPREMGAAAHLPGAIREHIESARCRLSWRERVGEPYPFHPEMAVPIEG